MFSGGDTCWLDNQMSGIRIESCYWDIGSDICRISGNKYIDNIENTWEVYPTWGSQCLVYFYQ